MRIADLNLSSDMMVEVTVLESPPFLSYGVSSPSSLTLYVGGNEKDMLMAITVLVVNSLHTCLFDGQSVATVDEYKKLRSICYPVPSVYELVNAILQ